MNLKERLLEQAQKIMQSESTEKLLTNPRFQEFLEKAFTIQNQLRESFEAGIQSFAKSLNLANRDEVLKLERLLQECEWKIEDLKEIIETEKSKKAKK